MEPSQEQSKAQQEFDAKQRAEYNSNDANLVRAVVDEMLNSFLKGAEYDAARAYQESNLQYYNAGAFQALLDVRDKFKQLK